MRCFDDVQGRLNQLAADMGQLKEYNLHAADRAAMPAKLGTAAVAGTTITERATAMAHSRHVWQILDDHAIEPRAAASTTR